MRRLLVSLSLVSLASFSFALVGGCSSDSNSDVAFGGAGGTAGQGGLAGGGGAGESAGGAGEATGGATGGAAGAADPLGGHADAGAAGSAGAPQATDDPTSTPIAAIDHDALFVVNGGDATISVINTETSEVAGTIALKYADYPHHIYLSADRSRLALAVPGMDMSQGHENVDGAMMPGIVMVLDATTGATIKARTLDAMNHNAIYSPDGTEIWTSQMMVGGSVLALDAETLETKATIAVGDSPAEITFSKDGSRAFAANSMSGTVSVIDVATKTVSETIPVGQSPVGAWQGSNGKAYVDNEMDKTLSTIDTKTLKVGLVYKLGFTPGMAALGPDNQVWVTDADAGRVIFKMTDKDMTMGKVATGAGAHAIAFNGDGKTAYITNQMAGTVSVIDIKSAKVTRTITVGDKPNGLRWRAK